MKKIGILTFFDVKNYGAALQALALQESIEQYGYRAEFVRCINLKNHHMKNVDIETYIRILKANNYSLKNYLITRQIEHSKYTRFDDFCERYMNLSHRAYYGISDLKEYETDYDAFVCGSDMVWSNIGQDLDIYFLTFTEYNKRISYAPSLTGRENETISEQKYYRERINGIKYLSFREQYGVDYSKRITGRDSDLVLDPTLLLNKEQWCDLLQIQKTDEKPYILCYMFGGVSKQFMSQISVLREKMKMNVRYIPVSNIEVNAELRSGYNPDYGPKEFVELFYNAGIVLTNSYHGLLFSLIMKKNFMIFHRGHSNEWAKHEKRLSNTLKLIDMKDRYKFEDDDFKMFDFNIDYEKIDYNIQQERKKSLLYLRRALDEVNECNNQKAQNDVVSQNISAIVDKNKCTGCSTCSLLCPKKCISMEINNEGFRAPVVDYEKCITCGKCLSSCSAHNPVKHSLPIKTFCGYGKSEMILNSASGGIFITLAQWFISEVQGTVYGAALDLEQGYTIHVKASSIEELSQMQNSKYVQSNITASMKSCKNDLDEGKYVLFSGTPCQIAALYRYLEKKYDRLYTIDIICHGVPSPLFFKKYLEKMKKYKISTFQFRHKLDVLNRRSAFDILIKDTTGKDKIIPGTQDVYYKMFLSGASYRECCYSCDYAENKRVGDITIGDCDSWKNYGDFSKDEITSSVLINSKKAANLWERVSIYFCFSKMDYEEECIINHQLRRPTTRPVARNNIYNDLNDLSWDEFKKKYEGSALERKIKNVLLKVIRR